MRRIVHLERDAIKAEVRRPAFPHHWLEHAQTLPPEVAGRLLTPHVAWASRPAMQALADQLTRNLEAFARGEPQHRVA